jgi:hypothetical protein
MMIWVIVLLCAIGLALMLIISFLESIYKRLVTIDIELRAFMGK